MDTLTSFRVSRQQLSFDNFYQMTSVSRRDRELEELRQTLRAVLRGLWRRRRVPFDAGPGTWNLTPRHLAVLAHVGSEGPRTVGEIAAELGLSLPAVSKLSRELEAQAFVRRSEHIDDRRRTVVDLNALTSKRVLAWVEQRNAPLAATLEALTAEERRALLKGLHLLAEALRKEAREGGCGRGHRRRRRSAGGAHDAG